MGPKELGKRIDGLIRRAAAPPRPERPQKSGELVAAQGGAELRLLEAAAGVPQHVEAFERVASLRGLAEKPYRALPCCAGTDGGVNRVLRRLAEPSSDGRRDQGVPLHRQQPLQRGKRRRPHRLRIGPDGIDQPSPRCNVERPVGSRQTVSQLRPDGSSCDESRESSLSPTMGTGRLSSPRLDFAAAHT